MLSKNQVVAIRNAIEKTYNGLCTISEYQKVEKENKSTGFKEVVVLENQPCRLSYSSISSANITGVMSHVTQSVKLFVSPDITIKAGSKIAVTQNGRMGTYKSSGEPAMFCTHQEIILELFKEWV